MSSKPVTKADMENFAVRLTDESPDHHAWLALVRYGMGTLLENQPLFIEIILREAGKQLQRSRAENRTISDEARAIFEELGLRLDIVCAGGISGCAGGPDCTSDHK